MGCNKLVAAPANVSVFCEAKMKCRKGISSRAFAIKKTVQKDGAINL